MSYYPAKQKCPNSSLNDSSTEWLKPLFPSHVWSYDSMQARTHNGGPFLVLNVIDEYTRECFSISVLMVGQSLPPRTCAVGWQRYRLSRSSSSLWENGYIESFNGKMRDELLNVEIFYTLKGARVLIEMWRKEYNNIRPHSSLGYRPPVTEAILAPTTQFQQFVLT